MEPRNSLFDLFLESRSSISSMVSTAESGLSTFLNTQTRLSSSFGISNSSLRVPERFDVNGRKDPFFHQLPLQVDLHVAGPLELLENDIVPCGFPYRSELWQ